MNERKNWLWLFFIMAIPFSAGLYFKNNMLCQISLVMLSTALLFIQLSRGYAVNRLWTEAISREKHPALYWLMITLNILALLFFIFAPLLVSK